MRDAMAAMTMFDERERAFENLFAHEEELRFLAVALRNPFLARWAAEQIGFRGESFHDYVRSFVRRAARPESEQALIDQVRLDFITEGVESSDDRIRNTLALATADAARQVRTEARGGVVRPSRINLSVLTVQE
jgi:hypothetical protein